MEKERITIAVATDLHYLASSLQDGKTAFQEMMKLADGRITDKSEELTDLFVQKMISLRPDAVILTGDLTFNGERESHEKLAVQLEKLEKEGIPVLAVPGNHDLENPMAGSYLGSVAEPVETIKKADFRNFYTSGSMISRYPSSLGFVYALSEKLWILAIDVNGNTYPGEVTRGTLLWAEGQLLRAKARGITVIGISHQNLMVHNKMFSTAYQMGGAKKLMELYRKYGVKLHLSGHIHIQHSMTEGGVTEIVTAALPLGFCQYGVLTVDQKAHTAEYRTETIEVLSEYAASYFQSLCVDKTLLEMSGTAMEKAAAVRLAKDLARLNLAYFQGRMDLTGDRENIRQEWKKEAPESFWNRYLESILEGEIRDHTRAGIDLA